MFFAAEGLSPKPANAKAITLKCTMSEWIIKIGYEYDGTPKIKNTDMSDAGPFFINVNKGLMTATVDGITYAATADPEKLFFISVFN